MLGVYCQILNTGVSLSLYHLSTFAFDCYLMSQGVFLLNLYFSVLILLK